MSSTIKNINKRATAHFREFHKRGCVLGLFFSIILLLTHVNSNAQCIVPSPSAPTLTGPQSLSMGASPTSYTANSSFATSYSWAFFPSGAGTISASGSSATVTWNSTYTGYAYITISVTDCAGATSATFPINIAGSLNYVKETTLRIAGVTAGSTLNTTLNGLSIGQKNVVYTYFDGLGREMQSVTQSAAPSGVDIVQPIAYDQQGREAIKYLPYASANSNDGSYKPTALTAGAGVFSFYKPSGVATSQQTNGIVVTADPFSVTGYEPSPLDRVVEQGAPGENFQLTPGTGDPNSGRHTGKVDYSANDVTTFVPGTIANNPGDHRAALYIATINQDESRTLTRTNNNTYYDAGQLEITITKNENWKPGDGCIGTTEEYKDKEGHMILRRTYDMKTPTTLEELSTYYVYDDVGNLCFVLPPGTLPDQNIAITTSNLDGYCYQYRYDQRNRLTQKKLPGKGWEFTVYNTLDQVVMTQTGNQRNFTPQQWTFTKYDAQGRVILTGYYNYPNSIKDANVDAPDQTAFLVLTNTFANPTFSLWEAPVNTTTSGYDGSSYPAGQGYIFLTINYYDNYTNIPSLPSTYDQHTNPAYSTMTNGLLVASKTNVLNSTNTLWTANYYNDLGLPVMIYKQHYLGGSSGASINNLDDYATTYNFNKQPLTITRAHYENVSNAGVLTLSSYDTYQYDVMGRKKNSYNRVRDHSNAWQPQILIAQNQYNDIGQLRTKRLNLPSPYTSYLQAIDYRYTARGWLSSINNANLDMTDATTNTTTGDADLFGEELSYDSPPTSFPQYNGNISYVKWKNGTPTGQTAQNQQAYDYRYDPLDRLINAMSLTGSTRNLYSEYARYNRMSDIISLGRYDQNPAINTPTPLQIDSLTYTDIYYRIQKLDNTATAPPCDACFIDGANLSVEYQYDIDGDVSQDKNKSIASITYNLMHQPQTVTFNNGNTVVYVYDANGTKLRKVTTVGTTVTTTEYIDGIEYDSGALAFIQTEEGRARWNGAAYAYEYDLEDHLGDTRVTFSDDGTGNPQILQMTNYYPFGATIGSLSFLSSIKNHYLYNHKEQQDETMLYDYGARFYDPVIGKWMEVDPMAEMGRRESPYGYAFDDPMRFTDPDGMWPDWGDVASTVHDVTVGVINAAFEDNTGIDAPSPHQNSTAYHAGRVIGHLAAMVQGETEVEGGGTVAVAGVVAAPESGGISLVASAGGAAVVAHGTVVTAHAVVGLVKDAVTLIKENRRSGEEHTTNQQEKNRNKHEDGQARKAKEQAKADEKYNNTKSNKGSKKSNNQKKAEKGDDYYKKGPKQTTN